MDFITEIQLKGTINNPLTNIVYCFKFFCNKNILVTQQSVKAGNETGGAAHLPLFSLRATLYCNTFWRRKKMWYSYYFSKVILQKQGYIIPYGWDRVAKQIPRSLLPLFPGDHLFTRTGVQAAWYSAQRNISKYMCVNLLGCISVQKPFEVHILLGWPFLAVWRNNKCLRPLFRQSI